MILQLTLFPYQFNDSSCCDYLLATNKDGYFVKFWVNKLNLYTR